MTIPEICIPIIIALTGIAYPISIQVIARIDDKYSSDSIRNLFEKERAWKFFRYSLWFALTIIAAYSLRDVFDLSVNVVHSIIWGLLLSSIVTVFSFLFFAETIFSYYSPGKLKSYLLNHSKSDLLFSELRDLLYYGVKHDSSFVCNELLSWFTKLYENRRKSNNINKHEELIYNKPLYSMIYDLQVLISSKPKYNNVNLQYKVFGGEWLLGDSYHKISKNTYRVLWEGLTLALSRKRPDLVLLYWKVAFQYIDPHLSPFPRKFNEQNECINEKEFKSRELERRIFSEFHFALGGLLLYSNEYSLIRTIFNYTTSHPPRYKLLPTTMNDIFEAFLWFWDPNDNNIPIISFQFPFPDFEGVAADGNIKYWISKYTALLFVRQFHIHSYYVNFNLTNYPQITNKNKQTLNDNLPYFVQLVDEIMGNKKLMDVLLYKDGNRTEDPKAFLTGLTDKVIEEL